MSCPSVTACEVRTYLNADMLEPDVHAVAGGVAAVVSVRGPGKTGANQDAAAIVAAGDGVVLLIADGCGGMSGGEEAARIAVQALTGHISAAAGEGQPMRAAILDGVEQAHREIVELKTGAGSTVAIVHLEGGEVRPYHVGDSQILVVGGRGKVKLVTTSHSPVGYAVESGMLGEAEAIDHEERHLVSNYLGCEGMHVEVGSGRALAMRDAVLVASDGVMDNLLLEELVELLRSGPIATAAAKIAGLASERMAAAVEGKPHKPDDLTLIVYSRRGGAVKARSRKATK